MKYISGIQQVGIGIPDVYEAWKWYRKNFGFDIPVFDDPGTAALMLPYTGGSPQQRHAVLAINLAGGGGFEIWQYTSRTPQPAQFEIQAGDLGIFIAKIKTNDVKKTWQCFKQRGLDILGELTEDISGQDCFYVRDPYGNIFQVLHSDNFFQRTSTLTGGAYGAMIGVTDMERSIEFYREVLGYDKILCEKTGVFDDFKALPGGMNKMHRVILTHGQPRKGPFSRMLGESTIELIRVLDRAPRKIYENRFWGDLGFIHLCYDVQGMKAIKKTCDTLGCPFTVDSNPGAYENGSGTFDMGEASGHFTYTEDPDGTLIEFVETHKVPILKKIGWFMDLKKRTPGKPLPDWMIRAMGLNRVKDKE